jgi:hypothetical protein
LLVVGFGQSDVSGEVIAEIERLRDSDAVRVLDLLVVRKDGDGVIEPLDHSGESDGAVVSALIGPSDEPAEVADEDLWSLDDAIPNDSVAAIALVEHRWAIPLRDAIRAGGGTPIADAWIHPTDLAAAGLSDAVPGSAN